jgi:hypothetical protein
LIGTARGERSARHDRFPVSGKSFSKNLPLARRPLSNSLPSSKQGHVTTAAELAGHFKHERFESALAESRTFLA